MIIFADSLIGGYADENATAIGAQPYCSTTSCSSTTSVPEPASAILLPLAVLFVFLLRALGAKATCASQYIVKSKSLP